MNILLLINKSKEHLFSALNMSIPSCHRDPKTPNLKMLVTIDYLNNLNSKDLNELFQKLGSKINAYHNINNEFVKKLKILAVMFNIEDLPKFNGEYGLDRYITIFSGGILQYHKQNINEGIAILTIQNAWRKCRYNPKYTMCHTIQIKMMEDDGYVFSK